ncbi:Uma2 family endonuclease [Synechocystis salina LEGE 06099]|uniref:Uma2 family endonuclease n=1 Tax=Synechocystis salina TaxID=945780 RepID=UPI001881AB13|nr:Uma2 family endonuclease [Synechocystis salina]MBE9203997.1 Uma2 family endonuclease [Synechocystis salina LEGE 06099]
MTAALDRQIVYPDSDGQPMADNTKQFSWIVLLKENLECLFADNPHVFVVLGRPKGDPAGICYAVRGSYRQWQEGNQPPQVVFEVLSPGNRLKEINKKRDFYDFYGVEEYEEYYVYDPDNNELVGLQRRQGKLTVIDEVEHWTSPRLGIHFELTPENLQIFYPDRRPFLTTVALAALAEQTEKRAELAEAENARLKELLRQAGIVETG